MKHLRPRREERDPLQFFAPVGTKECEMKCDRDVIITKTGPVIICKGCMRIVMDNRNER